MASKSSSLDPVRFIEENLHLAPVPDIPQIRLYTAHPGSGLWRLVDREPDPPPPYWAYQWGGGLVLARHILAHPGTATGKRILDLGAGSGLVAIAAAKAGAASVLAAEIDPNALAALALNAKANDVIVETIGADLTGGAPPQADLVLVGDLFYSAELAERVSAFLGRCLADGTRVLVGDPGRPHLPHPKLREIARYHVADFGNRHATEKPSLVFEFTG